LRTAVGNLIGGFVFTRSLYCQQTPRDRASGCAGEGVGRTAAMNLRATTDEEFDTTEVCSRRYMLNGY
jgi:hypothetical protein